MGLLAPDGTFLEVNETAMQLTSLPMEELKGMAVWQGPWFWDLPVSQAKLQSHLLTAQAGNISTFEIVAQGPDQTKIDVEVTYKPLFDVQGNVYQVLAEGWNITARKQAEAALTRKRRKIPPAGRKYSP
ncbi:MAG: PAS domain S-box protein, partial [Leptolyngbyaceae cyanobacterium SM2_3_12]|nr:PAS domain S-box protein [Leptolyngbyaceae cyanobacterium SM2_3_12]